MASDSDLERAALDSDAYSKKNYDPDLDAWVFSGGLELGLMGYRSKASLSGSPIDPSAPRATNILVGVDGPGNVIANNSDKSDLVSALVGANFEVMTPRFAESPFVPRLFMDLNVSAVLTSEVPIVRDGKAEPNNFGIPGGTGNLNPIGELLVRGTGAEATGQEQGPAIFLGFGTAFTFDLEGGSRLRVKPSVVLSRTRVEISGIAARAIRELNRTDGTLAPYRFIVLREDFSEVYYGIGPALELELDTNNRWGPFEVSVFVKGHANHILGDTDTRLLQANPDFPTENARWRYNQAPWTFRGSTGVRFRLVGDK